MTYEAPCLTKKVLMVGMDINGSGGIVSVVQTYRDAGFFARWNIEYLPTYKGKGLVLQLRIMTVALCRVLYSLVTRQIALIHVHSASRGSFWRKSIICAAARLFGVPYVFQLHSGEFPVFYHQECSRWQRAWVRKTLRDAKVVLALTTQWQRALQEIEPSARVVVLANPVAALQQLPVLRSEAKNILFLGRINRKKGVYDLIQAMPIVLQAAPHVRLVLAGDGEIAQAHSLAKELGVAHAIDLPGWLSDATKQSALDAADIVVLPSYFEGLPVCILEGMAQGIPVVSTRVGGIPDVVDNERTGLLVEPGDVAALAQSLIRLLQDETLRDRLRQAAHIQAKTQFSLPVVADTIDTVYAL